MTFGETLQQLRAHAGLTQAGLATASGMSLGVIRDYEQGKKEPTLRTAFKLAEALSVDVTVFKESLADDVQPVGAASAGSPQVPLAPPDPSDDVAADRLGLKGQHREAFMQGRREMRAELMAARAAVSQATGPTPETATGETAAATGSPQAKGKTTKGKGTRKKE